LTAEGVLKFLFQALEKNHSVLALKLKDELKDRIGKRRDKSLVSLEILQDPSSLENVENEFFRMTSKNEITKSAKNLMIRLFPAPPHKSRENENLAEHVEKMESEDSEFAPNDPNQQHIHITNEDILKRQLENFIRESNKSSQISYTDFKTLSREINIFSVTGKLTPNLSLLQAALLTIKPTQKERNFSIAGNFVSKKRTSLSDRSIDSLCFLKHHFT